MSIGVVNSALFGKTPSDLQALAADLGLPRYRATQLFEALYRGRVSSIDEMTVLPLALREQLTAAGYSVLRPEIVQTAKSIDGTERYLMRMADGETVETVWMPEGDGGERGDGSDAAEEEADELDSPEIGNTETQLSQARPQLPAPVIRKRFKDVGTLEKKRLSPRDDLYLQPGWMRRQLPILSHGEAGHQAQPDRR